MVGGESKRGTKLLVGDGLIQKLCGVEARSLLNISIKIVYQIYKCEGGEAAAAAVAAAAAT